MEDWEHEIVANAARNDGRSLNAYVVRKLLGEQNTVTHSIGTPQPATVTVTDGPPIAVNAETGEVIRKCEFCASKADWMTEEQESGNKHFVCDPCAQKRMGKTYNMFTRTAKKL